MSSPWSRYSYSYIILWSWLNVKLTFIVFCYVSHCKKVVYHLILMFIFWIEAFLSLAVESKLLFNQTDNELHPSSPLILHSWNFRIMISVEEFLALKSYICPKCRHLLDTGLAIYSRMTISCNMTEHIACLLDN